MRALTTALRGLGKGVMVILAGIWQFKLWCDKTQQSYGVLAPMSSRHVAGFVSCAAGTAGVIWLGDGHIPALPLAVISCAIGLALFWPLGAFAVGAIVTGWLYARRLVLVVTLAGAFVVLLTVPMDRQVAAHPPSMENDATDTVPHPRAGETILR